MRVNKDPDNIGPKFKHMGHYVFPDPGIFVTPTLDERKASFIESWLRARPVWLLRVRTERSLSMSSQMWRDFLATDIYNTIDRKERNAKRRREILDRMVPPPGAPGNIPVVKARGTQGEPMMWEGRPYPPGVLPSVKVVREILWELYHLNFAFEFIALDARMWKGSEDMTRKQRAVVIAMMIPDCPAITTENVGLAAESIRDRMPHICRLAEFMLEWHTSPHQFSAIVHQFRIGHLKNLPVERLAVIEDDVATFYTQTFFNVFGRAAQVPHRLYQPT